MTLASPIQWGWSYFWIQEQRRAPTGSTSIFPTGHLDHPLPLHHCHHLPRLLHRKVQRLGCSWNKFRSDVEGTKAIIFDIGSCRLRNDLGDDATLLRDLFTPMSKTKIKGQLCIMMTKQMLCCVCFVKCSFFWQEAIQVWLIWPHWGMIFWEGRSTMTLCDRTLTSLIYYTQCWFYKLFNFGTRI